MEEIPAASGISRQPLGIKGAGLAIEKVLSYA